MDNENLQLQPLWHGLADVPVKPTLRVERAGRHGRIAELSGEEPADAVELERWATWQLWGPILGLPRGHLPAHVEFGSCLSPDWKSIGLVEYRQRAQRHRALDRRSQLRLALGGVLLELADARLRVDSQVAYEALVAIRHRALELASIADPDLRRFVVLFERATQLRRLLNRSR